jgi:hypothetical protein
MANEDGKADTRPFLVHTWFGSAGAARVVGLHRAGQEYILLGVYMSFSGAMCGAFIRVIDAIRNKK